MSAFHWQGPKGHCLREATLVQGYLMGKQGKDILGNGESGWEKMALWGSIAHLWDCKQFSWTMWASWLGRCWEGRAQKGPECKPTNHFRTSSFSLQWKGPKVNSDQKMCTHWKRTPVTVFSCSDPFFSPNLHFLRQKGASPMTLVEGRFFVLNGNIISNENSDKNPVSST